jgi:hypothetical protein
MLGAAFALTVFQYPKTRVSETSAPVGLARANRHLCREQQSSHRLLALYLRRQPRTAFYDDAVWQSVIAECRSAGQFREMTLITIQLSRAVPQDQVILGRAVGPQSRVAPRQARSSSASATCPPPLALCWSDPAKSRSSGAEARAADPPQKRPSLAVRSRQWVDRVYRISTERINVDIAAFLALLGGPSEHCR